MSAQSQRQQATPPPEHQPHHRYSTETRLAIVETRWQDVVPTLATKTDIALIKKDIEAVEQRLTGEIQTVKQQLTGEMGTLRKDMDAMMNKIIIRVASIVVAAIAATGTIVALIQKIAN